MRQFSQRYFHIGKEKTYVQTNDSLVVNIPHKLKEGQIYVAFGQKNIPHSNNEKLIRIGDQNFVKVGFKEDVKVFLDGKVISYRLDSNGEKKQVYTLQSKEWNILNSIW